MLAESIIDGVLSAAKSISADRSRCLKMRFNRHACSECATQCRTEAIQIDEDVRILANKCTECMLCVSECPAGCFKPQGRDFYWFIEKLRIIRASALLPVLGCTARPDALCHSKTFCFGFLSEEHILALFVFLKDGLQIDVTGCGDCRNGFILHVLKKRMESVEGKTTLKISDRIRFVHNKADLDFQERLYSRRGFFNVLKNMTFSQATGLFDNYDSLEEIQSYSAKKLPVRRELLNRSLKALPEKPYRSLLENYYYIVHVAEDCNDCLACIGMCPTGALKIEDHGEGRGLSFSSSLCNGCGLCASFCPQRSVRIEKGFFGEDPFEFSNVANVKSFMKKRGRFHEKCENRPVGQASRLS